MMTEAVFAQALLLTGDLEEKKRQLLHVLCGAAASSLLLRLKDGITEADCGQDLVLAASLYAVAALGSTSEEVILEEFKAGDLTVRQSGGNKSVSAQALEKQAEYLMKPYLADRFAFVGV